MSACLQHTKHLPLLQPSALNDQLIFVDHRWQIEVLKLLPYGWDQQARVLRAFCRTRELQHPALLLRALLAYVLCCGCFNLLGAWAVLLGIADISDTAWRRRFIAASLWLDWLLRQLLSENAAPSAPAEAPQPASERNAAPPAPAEDPQPASERVVIIDSTIIVHPTGKGEDWRIHLGFDLSNARFDTMLLTDDHTSEDTAHYPLGRGDIAIADAGHGRRRLIVHTALQQQAQLVVRIHPRTCPLMDAAGEQVNIVAWLRTLKGRYHSRQLYCHYGKQRVGLRLIAVKLSDQATKKAQRRKRKKAIMDRRKITEETLFLAGWVLLVTNLPGREWPTDAVVRLYRARWQVELLFKQMKQMIMLGKLNVRNRQMGQAVLRAKLVAWALGEKISGGLRELLPKGGGWQRRPVSSWALRSLGLGQLRQAVGSGWTQERLEACVERLLRYICGRPRRRQHQESRIRAWLSRRMQAIEGMFLDASLSTTKRVA